MARARLEAARAVAASEAPVEAEADGALAAYSLSDA